MATLTPTPPVVLVGVVKLDRARCPQCRRVLAVQPPRGGDGSADVFPRHDYPREDERHGDLCPESRMTVSTSDYVERED